MREGEGGDTVASVAAPALLVPETIAINRVLPQMRDARTHMAIVFDEHGGTAGLVTMEDLLEELVGEIEDESDRAEPLALPRGDESMLLRGSLSIDDANEYLEEHLSLRRVEPLPEGDWDSVGGLIVEQLGRPADVGDEVEADAYRLPVLEMRGRSPPRPIQPSRTIIPLGPMTATEATNGTTNMADTPIDDDDAEPADPWQLLDDLDSADELAEAEEMPAGRSATGQPAAGPATRSGASSPAHTPSWCSSIRRACTSPRPRWAGASTAPLSRLARTPTPPSWSSMPPRGSVARAMPA